VAEFCRKRDSRKAERLAERKGSGRKSNSSRVGEASKSSSKDREKNRGVRGGPSNLSEEDNKDRLYFPARDETLII